MICCSFDTNLVLKTIIAHRHGDESRSCWWSKQRTFSAWLKCASGRPMVNFT